VREGGAVVLAVTRGGGVGGGQESARVISPTGTCAKERETRKKWPAHV
jgi:hypothetical protein